MGEKVFKYPIEEAFVVKENAIHECIDDLGKKLTWEERQKISKTANKIAGDKDFQNVIASAKIGTLTSKRFDHVKVFVDLLKVMASDVSVENDEGKSEKIRLWASDEAINVAINTVWSELSVTLDN